MIRYLAIIFSLLCLTVSVGANPYLIAEPTEFADYYVVTINGDAETVSPAIDEILMYDLEPLALGKHKISIAAAGNKEGEGIKQTFVVHKIQNKKWTIYTIEITDDNSMHFTEPLRVKIRTETQARTGSKKSSGCS